MRTVVVMALILTVGGCAGIRQTLGLYQKTADKGVTIGGSGSPAEGTAPPGSAGSETTPAGDRAASAKSAAREPKQVLPPGLGGDKEHRAYTGDAPKN